MTDRPLKIAYLCDITPLDTNLYSGGNARMYQALQRHGGEVTILSNSWHMAEPLRRLMHVLPEALNLRMRWHLHLLLGRLIARGVRRELAQGDFDVLFCAYSIQSMAGVGRLGAVVSAFTTDATPTTYKQSQVGQSFGSYLSASRYLDPWIARQEKRVLNDLDLILSPTHWLRDGIENTFAIADERVQIIPWGANIDPVATCEDINPLRSGAPVELLFVGRDWHSKGGPLALAVLAGLQAQDLPAHLTIIGCAPEGVEAGADIKIYPQLDKSKPDDMAIFEIAFKHAHFLINPSFESFGFAFCEASAYGLPSLAFRVGGVPVKDRVNGHALPLGSSADNFVAVISDYVANPVTHTALRKTARTEYETHLNWDAWGRAVMDQLRSRVADKR